MKRSTLAAQPETMLNPNFLLLCCYTLFSTMPGLVLNSLLSTYARNALGVTLSQAGVLVSLNAITSIAVHPLVGPASNRIDKRLLLLASGVLSVLSCLGFAFVPRYGAALAFRVVAGFSWALSAATGLVFVSETLPPDKTTSGIAYYGLIQIVVTAVGPTIALKAINRVGYTGMFLLMAVCAAAALISSWFLPSSVSNSKERFTLRSIRFKEIFAPEAIALACVGGLFAFNNGVQSSYALPYADARGFADAASLYFIIQAAATLLTRFTICRWLYERPLPFITSFAAVLLVFFAIVMAWGRSAFWMYLGAILMGVGYGCVIPAIQAACIQKTPKERKGSAGSTYLFAINIGIGGGGLIGGVVADHFGYCVLFLALLVPTAAAWILSHVFGREPGTE